MTAVTTPTKPTLASAILAKWRYIAAGVLAAAVIASALLVPGSKLRPALPKRNPRSRRSPTPAGKIKRNPYHADGANLYEDGKLIAVAGEKPAPPLLCRAYLCTRKATALVLGPYGHLPYCGKCGKEAKKNGKSARRNPRGRSQT